MVNCKIWRASSLLYLWAQRAYHTFITFGGHWALSCSLKGGWRNFSFLHFDFGCRREGVGSLWSGAGFCSEQSRTYVVDLWLFMFLEHQFISNQSERNYYELDELRFWDLFLGGAWMSQQFYYSIYFTSDQLYWWSSLFYFICLILQVPAGNYRGVLFVFPRVIWRCWSWMMRRKTSYFSSFSSSFYSSTISLILFCFISLNFGRTLTGITQPSKQ